MTALVKYDAARRALSEAVAVDEVKDLRDKADAMRIYAMQAKNKDMEVDAAEIRIRAERRLGELIAAQKQTEGLNRGASIAGSKAGANDGSSAVVTNDRRPKLSDVGVSKDLSSRAQKLAAVPVEEFESEVGEWRDRVKAEGARVSTRLETAGERELKKREAEPDDCGPDAAELAAMEAAAAADALAVEKLLESDDKLAEAFKEIKRLNAENAQLKLRVNGLMNEKNEAISLCKSVQRKLDKLQRIAA